MASLAVSVDQRSRRIRIDRTALGAELEQHQVPSIVELNAEPVPTHLRRLQLMRKPFVIHPCGSADGVARSFDHDISAPVESGEGHVVRSLSRARRLLTD